MSDIETRGNAYDQESIENNCRDTGVLSACACCVALAQVRTGVSNLSVVTSTKKTGRREFPGILVKMAGLIPGSATLSGADSRTVTSNETAKVEHAVEPSGEFNAGEPKNGSQPQEAMEDATVNSCDLNWHEDISLPKVKRFWAGLDGMAITAFGVALPTIMLLLMCASAPKRLTLVLLNHPLETVAELFLMMLIPLTNYFVWSLFCQGKTVFSRKLVTALGVALGSATIVSLICIAGIVTGSSQLAAATGTEFTGGFFWISVISLLSAAASSYLVYKIRARRDFEHSRRQVVTCAIAGMVLSSLVFLAAEYRPFSVRLAERMAVSAAETERNRGLSWLRQLNPERELRMECTDARAAGLPGLFLPLKSSTQQQLYFAVTGKPFSFADLGNMDLSSMPDEYLSRHVVGDKIPGLTLIRSTLSGSVHPNTLSSTINWTFVLKNETGTAQEGRTEIGLPSGAVLTGLTVWRKGEPEDAQFVASGKAEGATSMVTAGGDVPGMVTDLGHGRVLLHCYPVPQEEELKVRVAMVVPLKPDGAKSASLVLPNIIASNFGLSGEHLLRLRSNEKLQSGSKALASGIAPDKQQLLSGTLAEEQLQDSNLLVSVERSQVHKPVVVLDRLATHFAQEKQKAREEKLKQEAKAANDADEHVQVYIDGAKDVKSQLLEVSKALAEKHKESQSKKPQVKPRYLVQNLSRLEAAAPKHLVVVIDGSATMKDYISQVAASLESIPTGIPVSLIIASQEDARLLNPIALAGNMDKLKTIQFVGGQDNLRAVVKASELAGETKGGAVLWIHGPQPVINQEIYIMAPHVAPPSFYELALGAGTDTYEFFKNHTDIGPFSQVPRNTSKLSSDLTTFFSKWQPHNDTYVASLAEVTVKPADGITPSAEEAQELLALYANQETAKLLANRHIRKATTIAVSYGIVSPVSSALVGHVSRNQEPDPDAEESDVNTNDNQESELQGATNGTVGPQAGDATVVQGVNTAGTVRVNNLANLEALLNIIANGAELLCGIAGLLLVVNGFVNKSVVTYGETLQLGPHARIAIGISLVVFGLAVPGMINWLVASARDANLFT